MDAAVLDEIESAVLTPDILEAAGELTLARHAERAGQGRARRDAIERELRAVRAQIDRYVSAIGGGVDIGEVRAAVGERKARQQALERELLVLTFPPAGRLDRGALRAPLGEWRELLRQTPF